MPVNQTRIDEVADMLRGTAKCRHEVVTDEEEDDAEFLSALDESVIECETCGWWVDADEANEGICDECTNA